MYYKNDLPIIHFEKFPSTGMTLISKFSLR